MKQVIYGKHARVPPLLFLLPPSQYDPALNGQFKNLSSFLPLLKSQKFMLRILGNHYFNFVTF